jgi:hypothetical protein
VAQEGRKMKYQSCSCQPHKLERIGQSLCTQKSFEPKPPMTCIETSHVCRWGLGLLIFFWEVGERRDPVRLWGTESVVGACVLGLSFRVFVLCFKFLSFRVFFFFFKFFNTSLGSTC